MVAKVLVIATSRKTRGGITSVVKAHETGEQWKKYHCKWIQTHRDGPAWRKLWYLFTALIEYIVLLPFSDLVHVHFSEPPSAIRKKVFVRLAKAMNKEVVIHFHSFSSETTIDGKYKEVYRYLFSAADCSIVLSNFWRKAVGEAFHDSAIARKIRVVYNPCMPIPDYSKMQDENSNFANMENGLPKKYAVLYAGTVNERKGYADLLRAFAKIASTHKDWMLLFAGNGEIAKGKQIAHELGIEKQVLWLGWVTGPNKDRAFREATVFCLPSYAEGFPMGVLDAWAYGLPVVTTPVGGIPDVAEDGKNMLLFNPGDTDGLSSCLERMMDCDDLRDRISAESVKFSNGIFNITTCNQTIENIYNELLLRHKTMITWILENLVYPLFTKFSGGGTTRLTLAYLWVK